MKSFTTGALIATVIVLVAATAAMVTNLFAAGNNLARFGELSTALPIPNRGIVVTAPQNAVLRDRADPVVIPPDSQEEPPDEAAVGSDRRAPVYEEDDWDEKPYPEDAMDRVFTGYGSFDEEAQREVDAMFVELLDQFDAGDIKARPAP